MKSFAHAEDPRPVATFELDTMLRISGLTPDARAEIEKQLTIPNPKIAALRRWSGWVPPNTPRYIYGFVRAGEDLLVAPGFSARAWVIAREAGMVPRLVTAPFTFPPRTLDLVYNGESRPYQGRVVTSLMATRHALAVMPTGSGKTDTIVQLACRIDVPLLVIVHTIEIMRQWVERFELRTGYTPSTYGGKSKKKRAPLDGSEKVVVATVQSLRRSPAIIELFARTRQMVVLDEAHHAPAATFMDVLGQLHPNYRYGVTATDQRSDGLTQLMYWWLGPIRARVERHEVAEEGFIVEPELNVYATEFRHVFDRDETGEYQRMVEALSLDAGRLELVTSAIQRAAQRDPRRRHLVRAATMVGAEAVTAALRGHAGLDAVLLTGKTEKAERLEIVRRLKANEVQALVTTLVADEGLDAPGLTDVWLVTPIKDPGKLTQVIGRIVRPAMDKPTPRVHDFVDPMVISHGVNEQTGESTESRTLMNQFRTRFGKVYRDICTAGLNEGRALIEFWRGR